MEEFKLFSNNDVPRMAIPPATPSAKGGAWKGMTEQAHSYKYFMIGIALFVVIAVFLFHTVIKRTVGKTPEEVAAYLDDWMTRVWIPAKQWIGRMLLRGYVKSDGAIHTTHIPENTAINQFVKMMDVNESIQPI